MAVQAPKRVLADARPTQANTSASLQMRDQQKKPSNRLGALGPALGELAIRPAPDRDLLHRGTFHELALLATRRADRGGRRQQGKGNRTKNYRAHDQSPGLWSAEDAPTRAPRKGPPRKTRR